MLGPAGQLTNKADGIIPRTRSRFPENPISRVLFAWQLLWPTDQEKDQLDIWPRQGEHILLDYS
jgi:hypothetical protein